MSDALEKLATARLRAVDRAPYLASLLYLMTPRASGSLPMETMAITKWGHLLYAEKFVASQTVQQLAGVFCHEALHLFYEHADRADAIPRVDRFRWNLAADAEINDDLLAAGLIQRDWGAVLPSSFKAENGLLAETYYTLIKVVTVHLHCGSGAGNPVAGEPRGGRAPTALKAARAAAALDIQARQHSHGDIPAGLLRQAEEIASPPAVDWRVELRARIGRATTVRSGRYDYSYAKPSRRCSGRTDNNYVLLPAMVDYTPRAGVLVDTSGSMSERDLGLGLTQIGYILDALSYPLIVAVVDAETHWIGSIRHVRDLKAHLKGGGGTDFSEALPQLEKRVDFIIGISDCYATFPERAPTIPVLWLVPDGENRTKPPFGTVLIMCGSHSRDQAAER